MKRITHTQDINYFLELYNIWPDSNISGNRVQVALKEDIKLIRRNLPKQYQKYEPKTITIPANPHELATNTFCLYMITSFSDIGVMISFGYGSYFIPWSNIKELRYEEQK